jgi:hypothetical protein
MPDSPLYNVGRPRRSFLDDTYNVDERVAKWAQETGRMNPVEREGSVFMEFDDPTQPGGKRYVARKKSLVPAAGQREAAAGIATAGGDIDYGYTKPDGTQGNLKGRIMSRTGPEGAQEQFITEDKTYQPVLTNRKAQSFLPQFEQDMARRERDAERERMRAERMAEEGRAEERANRMADLAQARQLAGRKAEIGLNREATEADPDFKRRQAQADAISNAQLAKLAAEIEALKAQGAETNRERGNIQKMRGMAEQFKPSTNQGRRAYDDEMATSGDSVAAARAARAAEREELESGATRQATSFIGDVSKYAKQDATYFADDPTFDDLEGITSNAMKIRNYYVRMGDSEQTANEKVMAAFKAGAGDTGDDMMQELSNRLRGLLGSN